MRPAALIALALISGCDDADQGPCVPGEPAVLAPVTAWAVAEADADPFADLRPGELDCPDYAITIEGHSLEVDSGACNYVTLSQPLPAISPCDELGIDLAHLPLEAPEPAMAYLAVAVGDEVVWSRDIPIPNTQAIYSARWSMPEGAPEGTPVSVHMHNHGANSWYFGDVRRSPAR